jgi:diguanylate cyclase (GGDEF)-like protein
LAARAERICRSVNGRPINTSAGALEVTISAGAMSVGEDDSSYNVDLLLQKVDAALYRAKEQGRNRFVMTSLSPQVLLVAAS